MTFNKQFSPPLSPVLLAGLAFRPLPPVLLNPLLGHALGVMKKQHPEIFERLAELDNPVFLIDPIDLPFAFLLCPGPEHPGLRAIRDPSKVKPIATIRSSLQKLIELLEGKCDGDALAFSRDLVIEGDTEAVLTLRNAIDASDVNLLDDISSSFGVFASPVKICAGILGGVFNRLQEDLNILEKAVKSRSGRETTS